MLIGTLQNNTRMVEGDGKHSLRGGAGKETSLICRPGTTSCLCLGSGDAQGRREGKGARFSLDGEGRWDGALHLGKQLQTAASFNVDEE